MSDKTKGWIFVFFQFALLLVILFSSAYEFKYMNRPLTPVVHYIGVTFILIGAFLFTFTIISFGQRITPNPVPRDKAELRTTGIYSLLRHPMYFAILVMFLGVTLYFQAYYSMLWLAVLFVFFVLKASNEERFLSQKFPEYNQYKTTSKKLIPFIY